MKESVLRQEVGRLMRVAGWWDLATRDAMVCPRCHTKMLPPRGRPDSIYVSPNKFGCVIEFKMYDQPKGKQWDHVSAFGFSNIEPAQRIWMKVWDSYAKADPYTGIKKGGAYIGLGTRHGRTNSRNNPRMAWVVPWQRWLNMEEHLNGVGQSSLPLVARKGMNKRVQTNHLDALTLLSPWELRWETPNGWRFPDHHPLRPPNGEYLNLSEITQRWKDARAGRGYLSLFTPRHINEPSYSPCL